MHKYNQLWFLLGFDENILLHTFINDLLRVGVKQRSQHLILYTIYYLYERIIFMDKGM